MTTGIYKIENTVNKRVYVGSSRDVPKRLQRHFRELKQGIHPNQYLQNDWDKCGEKVFVFETLCCCEPTRIREIEQILLDALWDKQQNCYNIYKDAQSSLGLKPSPETRKKLSESHKGQKAWNKGVKMSPEFCEKISKSQIGKSRNLGRKHSIEQNKKHSEFMKGHTWNRGRKHTAEQNRQQSERRKGKILGPYKKKVVVS